MHLLRLQASEVQAYVFNGEFHSPSRVSPQKQGVATYAEILPLGMVV